jgi:hypothetical protein
MRGFFMEKTIHIKQLDKLTMQYISQRLNAALNQVANELNVMVELGSCNFRTHACRFQLNLAVLDAKGKPIKEEVEAFKNNALLFGFEHSDLGKEVTLEGKVYAISGFSPKNQKTPVLVRSKDKRTRKYSCRAVLEALGRKVPHWI